MKCFVIQPFDGALFDKRFEEVFDPAITKAGLEPYRVDRDASASIPIDAIERGICSADVCFAEISVDNPNVWFELGYAIAQHKELCIVCESARKKFPFDVQHRQIIRYDSGTLSDFERLGTKITERLAAILKKGSQLGKLEAQPIKEGSGLTHHEVIVICTILENMYGAESYTSIGAVISDMERLGYNRMAVNIGLKGLLSKQLVISREETDYNAEPYTALTLEEAGWSWILANQDSLNLRKEKRKSGVSAASDRPDLDDEIPF